MRSIDWKMTTLAALAASVLLAAPALAGISVVPPEACIDNDVDEESPEEEFFETVFLVAGEAYDDCVENAAIQGEINEGNAQKINSKCKNACEQALKALSKCVKKTGAKTGDAQKKAGDKEGGKAVKKANKEIAKELKGSAKEICDDFDLRF